jgi:hypothetical protein
MQGIRQPRDGTQIARSSHAALVSRDDAAVIADAPAQLGLSPSAVFAGQTQRRGVVSAGRRVGCLIIAPHSISTCPEQGSVRIRHTRRTPAACGGTLDLA